MKMFIILMIMTLILSCTTAQQNRIIDDYIQFKKETGYTPPVIERHFDRNGVFIGSTWK